MYKHTIKVPNVTLATDEESGEIVENIEYEVKTFVLKSFSLMPGKVSKRHRGDAEGQMWAAFEWGLTADQFDLLDGVPIAELEKMLRGWQKDAGFAEGE